MTIFSVNDRLGHRGRHSKILIVAAGFGIIEFLGKNIIPAATILRKDYTKNGKWSHNTYQIECPDKVWAIKYCQDFDNGTWLSSLTWEGALVEFCKNLSYYCSVPLEELALTDAMLEKAIRRIFPSVVEKLDDIQKAKTETQSLGSLFEDI